MAFSHCESGTVNPSLIMVFTSGKTYSYESSIMDSLFSVACESGITHSDASRAPSTLPLVFSDGNTHWKYNKHWFYKVVFLVI